MKFNIRHILPGTLCLLSAAAFADELPDSTIADRINSSETIMIVQPEALRLRLVHKSADNNSEQSATRTTPSGRSGFRIQIFDSNTRGARDEAQSRKRSVESRFSRMKAYVTFDSPYWRVRVGDFHTRAEAEHALTELRRSFPGYGASFRIVRDRINP
ncbi:MAG: SPOR domain-containing protein [Muribaculaceae bacterium]|nr:SPOR domain-containing protein [Muribaculaceae bacterium]